jgi:hypothetical protein
MPLPSLTMHGALQCKATAKHSQTRCLNPAAYGMPVCRLHGARRPETIRRGPDHPNYHHGRETLEAKAARSRALVELRELEGAMVVLGALEGPRWRGRKPGAGK